jgi:hypothetical protein
MNDSVCKKCNESIYTHMCNNLTVADSQFLRKILKRDQAFNLAQIYVKENSNDTKDAAILARAFLAEEEAHFKTRNDLEGALAVADEDIRCFSEDLKKAMESIEFWKEECQKLEDEVSKAKELK